MAFPTSMKVSWIGKLGGFAVVVALLWWTLGTPGLRGAEHGNWSAFADGAAHLQPAQCESLGAARDLCLAQALQHDAASPSSACAAIADPTLAESCRLDAVTNDPALDAAAYVAACKEIVPTLQWHCLSHGVHRALGKGAPFAAPADPAALPEAYSALAWRRDEADRRALGAALSAALGAAAPELCPKCSADLAPFCGAP